MRRSHSALLLLGHLALAPAARGAAVDDLMHVPRRLAARAGSLAISARFTTSTSGAQDPRVDAALARALDRLGAQTRVALAKPIRGKANATLVVEVQSPGLPVQSAAEDESYTLDVSPQRARLLCSGTCVGQAELAIRGKGAPGILVARLR